MERDKVLRLAALFRGYEGAHGTYGTPTANPGRGSKLEIKKTARTLRDPVTEDLWRQHVRGERGLGIIPIREDSACYWGAVDVDQYDLRLGEVVEKVERRKLPLVVCRSKSGGAHVYVFFAEPEPAGEVRAWLQATAASLGWGSSEIFPKQSEILADRGDLGNWMAMPYFGGDATERYGVKRGGGGMVLVEFLQYAEERRTTLATLRKVRVPKERKAGLEDGPPCLEHLTATGFPEGSRNSGLFALGVFCKKKYGDEWRDQLRRMNREHMRPPLQDEEVDEVVRNLERSEYNYQCRAQPCISYCNAPLCRTREFGVGGGGEFPTIAGMSVLDSEPPLWFVTVDERRLELSTDQLQNFKLFHKVAMEVLHVAYPPLSQKVWLGLVGAAMGSLEVVEAPREVSVQGYFMELLEDFLITRWQGDEAGDLKLGKPWLDEETGRYYFRLRDLMTHLEREGFRYWGRNIVSSRLKDFGGTHFFSRTRLGNVHCYWVPRTLFDSNVVEFPLPPSRRDPI